MILALFKSTFSQSQNGRTPFRMARGGFSDSRMNFIKEFFSGLKRNGGNQFSQTQKFSFQLSPLDSFVDTRMAI
jgi:hypothetical protein